MIAAATRRGTMFGGKCTCWILTDGTPVITHGIVSSLDAKELISFVLAHCEPVEFTDQYGVNWYSGAKSDDFIDALCDVCFHELVPDKQLELARMMLRENVLAGLSALRSRP